ncbi:unnamed protein product [Aspergillus oryzae]|uniref:Unnamed protein product n=1 Tax=Aspergillus oryzae TaxID=5062 RepID=A0AAN4YM03_ASPOZ|nr:unnamed protein product [Aspergillus oryzae]GMF87654.1 unnamed protein product [Aspergillus oryzae]GMG32802.1 unnamed protein product [Aspergillus oryzae]
MAQQRSTNAKICKCWGYTFEWIDGLHSSVEQLHSIMLNYDKLVDECLDRLDEISPPGSARTESTGSTDTKTPKRDLYSLLEKHAKDDPKLDELWSEINTVPDWVDWEQIKRGQEVFFRYGTPILNNRPEYYDIKKYGIPINDLDCIATIHTFSTSVVFLGLPRQGIFLRNQEIEDYIALWRLVAFYMGTPTDCFETTAQARAMMESLSVSEIDPTDTGRILAQNIILGLEYTAPTYASKEYLEAMARKLNGDELSDSLNLPRPSLYYQALVYGQCILVMAACYGLRVFPMLDQAIIELYYGLIMDKKEGLGGESFFEFKYVPFYSRTTRLGKRRVSQPAWFGVETLGQLGLLTAFLAGVALFCGSISGIKLLAPIVVPAAFVPDVY